MVQYKTKKEAIEAFVERDFKPIPQEWVKIVSEHKGEDIYAWPMWGTMWFVEFDSWGEKLLNASVRVCEPSECENHDKNKTCDICEDYEEMGGAMNFKDKDGNGTAVYVYEIDGQYLIGINGAGWNFYDGVWDKLYDFFGLDWHDHELKITSLHDAKADCKCGWHYVFTGEKTKQEIREEFEKHL